MSRNTNSVHAPHAPVRYSCEAEIIEGLHEFAVDELGSVPGVVKISARYPRPDAISFSFSGSLHSLFHLRTIQSVNRVVGFPIPRPKALLGDQYFKELLTAIREVIALHPANTFRTIGIAAAGAQSSVMQRIRNELAQALGLQSIEDKGDLLVRIRPSAGGTGWQCLVRLTPRPLATRNWRVRNYAAALNATVAYVMAKLTEPKVDDIYVNLCSGSGGLLVERLAIVASGVAIGVEHDAQAQVLARDNLAAAGYSDTLQLLTADAQTLPLPTGIATALAADLPFGQASGSHAENVSLYPQVILEAARIAKPGARFIVITHEVLLLERLLAAQSNWQMEQSLMITLRGLHPRIYVLRRA